MSSPQRISTDTTPSMLLALLATVAKTRFATLDDALSTSLSMAARMADVRSAFVARVDNVKLEVLGSWDDGGCAIPAGGVIPAEESFCQYVRAGGVPVVIPDASRDPRVQNVASRHDYTIGAYMGVPLILDSGELFGTFCLLDTEPRQFSEDQLSALTILSQQLVGLIERELSTKVAVRHDRDTSADLGAVLSALDEQQAVMGMVLHDLLTPVNILRGYTDLLDRGVFGPIAPDQARTLGQMARMIRSMQRLSTDMMDVIAAESSGLLVTSTLYQPDVLVEHIGAICAEQADEQDLSLVVDIPEALPTVVGDPERVEQILINLVSNAIRYTTVGGVTLRAELLDDQIQYCVQDTGPGIAAADLARVWELGVRGERSERGLGLGLYIVRRLAEAMGGSVSLESDLEAGSRFYVRLPLRIERPTRVRLL